MENILLIIILTVTVLVSLGLAGAVYFLQFRKDGERTSRMPDEPCDMPVPVNPGSLYNRPPPAPVPVSVSSLRNQNSWFGAPDGSRDGDTCTRRLFDPQPQPPMSENVAENRFLDNEYHISLRIITKENEQNREITVNGEFTVGRLPTCGLCIGEQAVSRLHCVLIAKYDGLFVSNRSSTNVTKLNGSKLTDAQPLKTGDTLNIGDVRLSVQNVRRNGMY